MNGSRQRRSNRSLTPRQLKQAYSYRVLDKDNSDEMDTFRAKEDDRREKRNKAVDQNRPLNIQTTPEKELPDGDDDDWQEEEDDEKPSPMMRSELNNSLQRSKQREYWMLSQQKARQSGFRKNRRNSLEKNFQGNQNMSDDWKKFQSCTSLKSVDADSSNEFLRSPKKSVSKNFIESHFSQVERISDIYVPSHRQVAQETMETNVNVLENFKCAIITAFLAIACFIVVFIIYKNY